MMKIVGDTMLKNPAAAHLLPSIAQYQLNYPSVSGGLVISGQKFDFSSQVLA